MQNKLLFLSVLFVHFVYGQTHLIRGFCVDEKGIPIPGLKVLVENTSNGVYTDLKGTFQLSVTKPNNDDTTLVLSAPEYETRRIPIVFDAFVIELGRWVMKPILLNDDVLPLVDFENDIDLHTDENQPFYMGQLNARRSLFLEVASFQFSNSFFSLRGLHQSHQKLRINGIEMNSFENGGVRWAEWGGLNDIINRAQTVHYGLSSASLFGGLLGEIDIQIRPSSFRSGTKFSQSFSNTSYQYRSMLSHHSKTSKHGWNFSFLGSFRKGNGGVVHGTTYDAFSILGAIEKNWNKNHSTWFLTWYSPSYRGRNAPLTKEIFDLKGNSYNPYWGWDKGKIRNARIARTQTPHFVFNHQINFSEKTNFLISAAYQNGDQGSSRLLYNGVRPAGEGYVGGGLNPDPTYYQKLPSYFLRDTYNLEFDKAYLSQKELEEDGQLNWTEMRNANEFIPTGSARYILYEDIKEETKKSFSGTLFFNFDSGGLWHSSISYQDSKALYYAQPIDFLGGLHLWDIDPYAEDLQSASNNLLNKEPKISLKEPFQYHYQFLSKKIQINSLLEKTWNQFSIFIAGNYQNLSFQRKGLFQNGGFPTNSLGKGSQIFFNPWMIRTGLSISMYGGNWLTLSAAKAKEAHTIRGLYPNPRENNSILLNRNPISILKLEGKYRWQTDWSDLNVAAYWITKNNQNQIGFYFADGVGGDQALFVQEALTNLNTLHQGLEISWKINIMELVELKSVAAYGNHFYANSPDLTLYTEPSQSAKASGFENGLKSFGKANLKGYHLANGPHQAYSFGVQYNDPSYWRISAILNYFSTIYLQPNPLKRTSNFLLDSSGFPLVLIDKQEVSSLLKQEQFPSYFILNATGSKSWKVGDNYFGFFISLQNILNTEYKTGGFEQGRNANFTNTKEDVLRKTPIFSPKYWWGRGTTFYSSLYFRF